MDAKKVEIRCIGFPKGKVPKFSEVLPLDVINVKGIGGENVYYYIAFKRG